MDKKNPKAFICHASEDKERFVLGFAEKLLGEGVDAWVDKWEMQLGDSLVHKIFEEGIKQCDTFIIILSKFSVNKPWVKEELDSAVVKRIEEKMRLIPVTIDKDIEIPQSIRHLLRKPINDLSNYEEEFKDIVKSIYGVTEKPPLGEEPNFTKVEDISGFAKIDSVILKIVGEIVYEADERRLLYTDEVFKRASALGLSQEAAVNSLEILEGKRYWKILKNRRSIERSLITVTYFGFIKFCELFIKEFDAILKGTISCIVNEGMKDSNAIASKLGCKFAMTESLFGYFKDSGYMTAIIGNRGRGAIIYDITAEGQRYFENALL
ncbi:MAG: toll/interleukin-1 receptor domain-containing protein [Candidatus Omnitrophica bacterium]|nr:toll/interleukin-1 receptor domain-containing protein [Candidatus Omnitrophota bacterium]